MFNHKSERRGVEFVTRKITKAFKAAGYEIEFEGEGINEVGRDKNTGKELIKVNPKFFRPAEVELLLGNPAKAEKALNWKRKVSFDELVQRMVANDIQLEAL